MGTPFPRREGVQERAHQQRRKTEGQADQGELAAVQTSYEMSADAEVIQLLPAQQPEAAGLICMDTTVRTATAEMQQQRTHKPAVAGFTGMAVAVMAAGVAEEMLVAVPAGQTLSGNPKRQALLFCSPR